MQESSGQPAARPSRRVKSVEHAIDVLQVIADAGRAVGVSEIARQTQLSKASVHHLLATLESRRFVIRDPGTARYRLSWALYEMGSSVVRDVNLSRVARLYLDRLATQTGELVLLGILDGDSVLYLDRGEGDSRLQMAANAGRRGPLHATASGKVLLAFSNEPQLWQRIIDGPLVRYTSTTITDPDRLRAELAQVRRQGYATCWQEREVGLCSVAIALKDYTGTAAGSLAVAGPSIRLTKATLQSHLSQLQAAGQAIDTHLGVREQSLAPHPNEWDGHG